MATAIAALTSFSTATTALAAEVNANFTAIRTPVNADVLWLTKTGQTVTQTVTFSASQTFSSGIGLTGSLTMATAESKIVPGATSLSLRNTGDSADNLILTDAGAATFRGTVGGITTLSCTTVTATNLGGTLSTAAQTSVTSLGTLTALTIGGNLTFTGASRKIISGTTGMTFRNTADNASWLAWTEGGDITLLPPTAGNVVLGIQSLAESATAGFAQISAMAGPPVGAAQSGALVVDQGNLRLYVKIGSTWRYAALT